MRNLKPEARWAMHIMMETVGRETKNKFSLVADPVRLRDWPEGIRLNLQPGTRSSLPQGLMYERVQSSARSWNGYIFPGNNKSLV